jgi:hypothetical protein
MGFGCREARPPAGTRRGFGAARPDTGSATPCVASDGCMAFSLADRAAATRMRVECSTFAEFGEGRREGAKR